MKNYKSNLIFICLCDIIIGIIYFNRVDNQKTKLPNDIRWVVNSNEYKILCEQIYDNAAHITKKIYSNDNQAIIMDLDETVLDNSLYQVENFYQNKTFNMESWSKWVLREEASLIPGVKEYIQLLRNLNIQLIFISNRMNDRLESTKENLKKLGIYDDNDIYLLRLNKTDKKHVRRNEVYNGSGRMQSHGKFNVIIYIGDAMGDFPEDKNGFNFILPNPMYGKW